ncbi:hypothetical protein BDN67DRAFT_965475 [Paxillus ammoniavirescens]|nr:hypothetical protein BDN67DRAFT_965475 [Paxillus ammoniavirescens]
MEQMVDLLFASLVEGNRLLWAHHSHFTVHSIAFCAKRHHDDRHGIIQLLRHEEKQVFFNHLTTFLPLLFLMNLFHHATVRFLRAFFVELFAGDDMSMHPTSFQPKLEYPLLVP